MIRLKRLATDVIILAAFFTACVFAYPYITP